MKTSVTAKASRYNPKPLAQRSIDTIATPGRVGLTKMSTLVRNEGEVVVQTPKMPGTRKHVIAQLGGVKITGENLARAVNLKKPDDWVLLEFDGYVWQTLYRSKP